MTQPESVQPTTTEQPAVTPAAAPVYTSQSARMAARISHDGWEVLPDLQHARHPESGRTCRLADAYEDLALGLPPEREDLVELFGEV